MNQLSSKTALITGSSSGIGRAIALLFAEEGADVIVTSNVSVTEGNEVAKTIRDMGRRSMYIQADLSSRCGVDKLFETIKTEFSHIDILVNNAGRTFSVEFENISADTLLKDINTNFISMALCSQKVVELMDKGHIINTSSMRGIDYAGRVSIMGYSAAKSAVNSFTKNLAYKLAPNILVNAVAPGITCTEALYKSSSKLFDQWRENTPLKRLITPEEIAQVYLFLATTTIMTGSIIVADCGFSILGH